MQAGHAGPDKLKFFLVNVAYQRAQGMLGLRLAHLVSVTF